MLSNKAVKDIQSLRDKKRRDEAGQFVAEGPKIVAEMITAAPGAIVCVYALQQWVAANQGLAANVPVTVIDERTLERISHLQTPNLVLALMRQFPAVPPTVTSGWALYLDTVQDPGNMGTIIRLADWFAINHIVCSTGCADVYNPKVVQSTMASLARVNIWTDAGGDWLHAQQVPVFAAALDGRSLYEQEKPKAGILIIGNESKGIRAEYLSLATHAVTIPRLGQAESLNAAVATGILLSHLVGAP